MTTPNRPPHRPPLVLVPGIQGRWEWMRPAVEALARHFSVLTFTLAGERTSGHPFDRRLGFDNFVVQIDRVLEDAGVASAAVCGVSYGGLIALRYAALRQDRVRQLVLASALAPGWEPDARARFYSRAPVLLSPLFAAGAIGRAAPELLSAEPRPLRCAVMTARHLLRVARAPMAPRLMRERIRLLQGIDFDRCARAIRVPTLLITGEPRLDKVVPTAVTLRYTQSIPEAEVAVLERTGHLGIVTRPGPFADLVSGFVRRAEAAHANEPRRKAAR